MRAADARALFDGNAKTYAAVNTVLSLGLDRRWRRWVAESALDRPGAHVLDAMTGTGEVAVEVARLGGRVTAVDVSPMMLRQASDRAAAAGVTLRPVLTDLLAPLDLPGTPFDAACLSFGLRYADDKVALLRELGRWLRADGRLVVLEFCMPDDTLLSRIAGLYFFRLLPRLGTALTGERALYDYLRDSTRTIGRAEQVRDIIQQAGFSISEQRRFGFGLVAGFIAIQGGWPVASDSDDGASAWGR